MPQRLDRWIGSAVSSILKDASVVERLVYLRVPPTRLLGNLGFFRRDGAEQLQVSLDTPHARRSPAKAPACDRERGARSLTTFSI